MAKKKAATATLSHEKRRARRAEIVSAVRGGATIAQLTRRFQVGYSTIRDACIEQGVTPPEKSAPSPVKKDTVLLVLRDLVDRYGTLQEIGDKHGISRQRVHTIAVAARRCGWAV